MSSSPPPRGTPPPAGQSSRMPRFMQKQPSRDRSKSDSADKHQRRNEQPPLIVEPPPSPAPVPIPSPRARTRSERPAASAPSPQHMTSLYASTGPSNTRIGDLPTRLSGWFAHTFSSSSNDLSLPAILAQHPARPDSSASSPRRGPAALLAAAKHGRDKAMRYLLDSDAVPDRCTDPIWLLGQQHPGWEGPADPVLPPREKRVLKPRRGSWRSSSSSAASSSADGHSSPASSTSYAGSAVSAVSKSSAVSASSSKSKTVDLSAAWPPAFYDDFTSRVWLTYRSHMPQPIRDAALEDLSPCSVASPSVDPRQYASREEAGQSPVVGRKWPWAAEKTWSADTGWGCMLRTGQSLLANALIGVHLGRDWRRPPAPTATAEYAMYVRILTWFLDTPDPRAPFSVHRMALAGKDLGTPVGQWFGPSVAAGGIRTLVSAFPECGLAVALATDGTLYQSEVFAASHGDATGRNHKGQTQKTPKRTSWGDRPVLLLLGVRLGIEGVNPIYYESLKMLYTFPQSVGIAGGRPSSSYYFVGAQADALFYLDPHNPRPAVPLRPPPRDGSTMNESGSFSMDQLSAEVRGLGRTSTESTSREMEGGAREKRTRGASPVSPASPASSKAGSSNFSYHDHAPSAPSPLARGFSSSGEGSVSSPRAARTHHPRASGSRESSWASGSGEGSGSVSTSTSGYGYEDGGDGDISVSVTMDDDVDERWEVDDDEVRAPPPVYGDWAGVRVAGSSPRKSGRVVSTPPYSMPATAPASPALSTSGAHAHAPPLDPLQLHYINAYSAAELRTFHCERVRKMPLAGLDPSMLIGFVCRDEAEWVDLRRRVGELPRAIFSIQDELPTWPADMDDNMGLESMSEPDELDGESNDGSLSMSVSVGTGIEDEADEEEEFFDASASSGSRYAHAHARREGGRERARRSTDTTTDEDPAGPVTPGPTSRFDIRPPPTKGDAGGFAGPGFGPEEGGGDGGEIEDDWVDPVMSVGEGSLGLGASVQREVREVKVEREREMGDERERQRTRSSYRERDRGKERDRDRDRERGKERDSAPRIASGSTSAAAATSSSPSTSGKPKKTKRQVPVPVPSVRIPPAGAAQQQEHYPFPVTPAEDAGAAYVHAPTAAERTRSTSGRRAQTQTLQQQTPAYRMHNARARDGGRTQSGGVKGILTDS